MLKPKHKPPSLDMIRRALLVASDSLGHDGEIEFDIDVSDEELLKSVSACDDWIDEGGFYVRAWVWVSNQDVVRSVKHE